MGRATGSPVHIRLPENRPYDFAFGRLTRAMQSAGGLPVEGYRKEDQDVVSVATVKQAKKWVYLHLVKPIRRRREAHEQEGIDGLRRLARA